MLCLRAGMDPRPYRLAFFIFLFNTYFFSCKQRLLMKNANCYKITAVFPVIISRKPYIFSDRKDFLLRFIFYSKFLTILVTRPDFVRILRSFQ